MPGPTRYVASSADPGQRVYTDADDPKALIGVSDALNRAVAAFNAGDRQRAMAAVRTIMDEHHGFPAAFGMYASMQRSTGDLPGAIATLEDIVRRDIADVRVLVVLAGYLEEAGALFAATHGRRLRVATKYPMLTRRFFGSKGVVSYRTVESLGATEGAPAAGNAEAIVDIARG